MNLMLRLYWCAQNKLLQAKQKDQMSLGKYEGGKGGRYGGYTKKRN
jgi:hypothetical protein